MPAVSQLTSDPAFETQLFWSQYKTPIITVAVLLVLTGLGYVGYQVYTARRTADSTALLAAAKSAQDYQQVIERYPKSDAASSAYLLLGEQLRTEKKYADANVTLHKFID